MTPRTFANILKGRQYAREEKEAIFKQEMEMHRELIITILSPHLSKADRKKPIQQLYPLPWDKEKTKPGARKKKEKLTPEEVKTFLEKQKIAR